MKRTTLLALALASAAWGCAQQDSTVLGVSASPSLILAVGDTAVSIQGRVYVLPVQHGGFVETNPHTGATFRRDVLPITVMASPGAEPTGAQLSLGLLGAARLGSYRVHVPGSLSSDVPEFYATLIVPRASGGARHFLMNRGVLTITHLNPLQGSLELGASQVMDFGAEASVGTTVRSSPARLTVSGTLGAAVR